jgi:hypothetical protein
VQPPDVADNPGIRRQAQDFPRFTADTWLACKAGTSMRL